MSETFRVPFLPDLSPLRPRNRILDFMDKSMIANRIPIRAMEVPCAMKGKKKKKVKKKRKEEKEEEKVESRRWEGSAGKDERGNRKKRVLPSGGSLYPSNLHLSFSLSLSFSIFLSSLFSSFFFSSSLRESSVSRTGTVAGLSGIRLNQLFSSLLICLFLSIIWLM